jgi:hypothetical protein
VLKRRKGVCHQSVHITKGGFPPGFPHIPTHTHTLSHIGRAGGRAPPTPPQKGREGGVTADFCFWGGAHLPARKNLNCKNPRISPGFFTHPHSHTHSHIHFCTLPHLPTFEFQNERRFLAVFRKSKKICKGFLCFREFFTVLGRILTIPIQDVCQLTVQVARSGNPRGFPHVPTHTHTLTRGPCENVAEPSGLCSFPLHVLCLVRS